MRSVVFSLVAVAALLVACSKKPAEAPAPAAADASAPAAASSPAPAAAGPETPITLAQMPAPKAGLWQRVSTQDADAPQTDSKCLEGKPIDPTEDGPKCATMTAKRTASGGAVVDATCANNGIEAKLHMAVEGDFVKAFTSDTSMTMTGGPGGALNLKNHSVWTYKGACPAKG